MQIVFSRVKGHPWQHGGIYYAKQEHSQHSASRIWVTEDSETADTTLTTLVFSSQDGHGKSHCDMNRDLL